MSLHCREMGRGNHHGINRPMAVDIRRRTQKPNPSWGLVLADGRSRLIEPEDSVKVLRGKCVLAQHPFGDAAIGTDGPTGFTRGRKIDRVKTFLGNPNPLVP